MQSFVRKVLISLGLVASLGLAGCGMLSERSLGDNIVRGLDRLPFVYRPIIQQGNVVSQEAMNSLQPGMSKRQVEFVMGTPMLTDVFHNNRWDYVFTLGKGSSPTEFQRIALFFEDERLTRIEGDMRPEPLEERQPTEQDVVVSVPDWEGDNRSWIRRRLGDIGL
jgi:outer membrane protein assembly factor BamE